MGFDVFLSSNSREGYTQDVVDLFSKPSGASQQFRYDRKWVAQDVLDRVGKGTYKGEKPAILCYIDQKTTNTTPKILPVRFAKITAVREHGSTISIVFTLEELCTFDQLDAFNATIRSAEPELPEYHDGKLSGKYWLFDAADTFDAIGRSNEQTDWERLVKTYYDTPNSLSDMPFYRFEGIRQIGSKTALQPTNEDGELTYTLDGGKRYEVSIYHYHPKDDFPEYTLSVYSDDENLVPLNGDTRVFNTRYDQKDYKFEAKQIILGASSSLAFRRTEKGSGKLIWEDFVLRVTIKPSAKLALAYVTMVAVGFAVPFIVRTYSNPDNNAPVIWAALFGGLLVGAATLLKDKIRL